MGILGRFDRRKDRSNFRLIKHPAKHRMGTKAQNVSTSSNYRTLPSLPQQAQTEIHESPLDVINDIKHLSDNTNGRFGHIITVDNTTSTTIRKEVIDLLESNSDHSCTALEMANALAQSQACLESHSKINTNPSMPKFGENARLVADSAGSSKRNHSRIQSRGKSLFKLLGRYKKSSRKIEKESMQSRYQWVNALNRLEKYPSSRDKSISTWEEAKKSLEQVISFPCPPLSSKDSHHDQGMESSRKHLVPSVEKNSFKNLETDIEIVQEHVQALSVSNGKWKQIASYPNQEILNKKGREGHDEEEDLEILIQKESIEKADLYFNARIRTAEELANQLQKSEAVQKLEERRVKDEARKRASLLMRALNEDERKTVETAIHGLGPGGEIIAQAGADSVQRSSIQTLKPGMWLNDEIIHYFYIMLAKRDEELCKHDPSRKRSHFFKSFFITKLLNEGNASCDGKYEYRNVKRWSKKVPGKDIFNLDKILFPINMGNMHWICAAIFMKDKRIQIYDSMGSNGNRYLEALFSYVQDEHIDKKKTPLPDADSWQLVPTQRDTPRQTNGKLPSTLEVFKNLLGRSAMSVLIFDGYHTFTFQSLFLVVTA